MDFVSVVFGTGLKKKQLINVEEDIGKTSGRLREDILPLAPRPKLHVGKIPKIFGKKLLKIQQILARFATFSTKIIKKIQQFLTKH